MVAVTVSSLLKRTHRRDYQMASHQYRSECRGVKTICIGDTSDEEVERIKMFYMQNRSAKQLGELDRWKCISGE